MSDKDIVNPTFIMVIEIHAITFSRNFLRMLKHTKAIGLFKKKLYVFVNIEKEKMFLLPSISKL